MHKELESDISRLTLGGNNSSLNDFGSNIHWNTFGSSMTPLLPCYYTTSKALFVEQSQVPYAMVES